MGAFSIWHIVIVAVVAAFLFFGWKQLPDMARSFGRSLRVFKTEIKGMSEDDSAREKAREDAEPKQLEARPAPAQPVARAEAVRHPAAAPVAPPAVPVVRPAVPAPQPVAAGARPRPTPSPNGHPRG